MNATGTRIFGSAPVFKEWFKRIYDAVKARGH
jgi:hypothetical protein